MHIQDYLKILRSYWRFLAGITVLGLVAGIGFSAVQSPRYSATTQVFVSTPDATSVSDLSIGTSFTQQAVKNYAAVAESRLVLRRVIARLGLSESMDVLKSDISTEVPLDTAVLKISVRDKSAKNAAAIANAISTELAGVVASLSAATSSDSAVKITQIDDAVVNPHPVSPNVPVNALAGLLAGALLAYAVAIARSLLETRLRSEKDVEETTGLPTLGAVPFQRRAESRDLLRPGSRTDPVVAEGYRSLRTNLQFFDAGRLRSLVVTSTVEGEGKTTTAVNLAATMAATTKRVLLVDGDLRRPSVADALGIDGGVGLTEVLIGRASLDQALQTVGSSSLVVLPSGSVPPNPSELLQSPQMAALLAELQERFEIVLVDAPPVLPVADALLLGKQTDGALFVCGAGRARRAEVKKALASLTKVDVRVLGAVASMVPRRTMHGYRYDAYTSAPPATVAAVAS